MGEAVAVVGEGIPSVTDNAPDMAGLKAFGEVVRDLLLERGISTNIGNPDWRKFSDSLPGVHYETLRKAVAGERAPGNGLMEAVAAGFDVDPHVFVEYRLLEARDDFDPKKVGVEQAVANLEAWAESRPEKPKRRKGS